MGLCRYSHWLVWGVNHGALRSWPYWVREFIADVWNSIACMHYGHDTTDVQIWKDPELGFSRPPTCTLCCTELKVDGVYVKHRKRKWM